MCKTTTAIAAMAATTDKANGERATNEQQEQGSHQLEQRAPPFCRFWVKIYNAVPKIGFGGFDVSITLLTMAVLTSLRFFFEMVVQERIFGWPQNAQVTKEAAASAVAIFHSVNLLPALLATFLFYGYAPSEKIGVAPKWYQQCVCALLQFCTGYMVYDGILNIAMLKLHYQDGGLNASDYMFLGHHLATSLYMTSARVLGAGHMSAMMCMFLGELTNPLHNSFYIAEFAQGIDCCNGELSQQLHYYIMMAFSALYVIIRSVFGPLVCLHMTFDLWARGRRQSGIPIWVLSIWTFLIWGVIIGSIPWIQDCHNMFQKGLSQSTFTGSGVESLSSEL